MWQSLRISHMVLRLSFAAVFLWLGVEMFFHPALAASLIGGASFIHNSDLTAYIFGAVEILIGLSFLINIFVDFFAAVAFLILIVSMGLYGFREVVATNLGIFGGLLALIFWPNRNFRNY